MNMQHAFEVLRAVNALPGAFDLPGVARAVGLNPLEVETICMILSSDAIDDGPWLRLSAGRLYVAGVERDGEASTGGYKVIEEITDNPNLELVATMSAFKFEALTGTTMGGRRSKLTRAVLPTRAHKQHRGDPAARAQRANTKFAEPPVATPVDSALNLCPRCNAEPRSEPGGICKTCRRRQDRGRKR